VGTDIQWTDETWNPVTGCSKVSPGCAHCYAERVAIRLWPSQYPNLPPGPDATLEQVRHGRPRQFTDVQCHEGRLDQPLRWKKPRKVFVNSMSDLFHEDVPDAFIDLVFAVMSLAPQHTFQILTKRAERMRAYMSAGEDVLPSRWQEAFSEMGIEPPLDDLARDLRRQGADMDEQESANWERAWSNIGHGPWPPPNVWFGASVENQRFADERIPILLQTPAAMRFISAEPLLEHIRLTEVAVPDQHAGKYAGHGHTFNALSREDDLTLFNAPAHLDWVIVGGESGTGARPFDVACARSIVKQCQVAGVPVFVKQLGASPLVEREVGSAKGGCHVPLNLRDRKGCDMTEWPEDLRVREMPVVYP
jgi:protein gp37